MAKSKKPKEKPVKKPKATPLTTTDDDGIVGGRPDDRNPPKKP
jgi:hypothetical protein